MKSVFTLNSHVDRMLKTAKYDTAKLVNAIQASLNSASQVDETNKRGNVNLVAKGIEFQFTEGSNAKYRGKTDAPARFAQWHDDIAKTFKRNGDPSGELTPDIIPASSRSWLDDKFSLNAPVVPAKGKRNGDIDKVPAPAVPA